jgi:hypothetical protein
MVTDTLIDSFPVSQYDASVAEVLKEIDEYQKLGPDWDSEGALPISEEAAHLAVWLVQMVALSAKHQRVSWQAPVAGPNADGGINLEWESKGRRLLVIVLPGQVPDVECVIEEDGIAPRGLQASVWDSIDHALWAMSGG